MVLAYFPAFLFHSKNAIFSYVPYRSAKLTAAVPVIVEQSPTVEPFEIQGKHLHPVIAKIGIHRSENFGKRLQDILYKVFLASFQYNGCRIGSIAAKN